MILLHKQIIDSVKSGDIVISPFDVSRLGPNSYDLTLNKTILTYTSSTLDPKVQEPTRSHCLKETGSTLIPNIVYLGSTNEIAGSEKFIPRIEGVSSIARLGLAVHITAGFGDLGFVGNWTLELYCIQPIIIYPNMRIAQVYFESCDSDENSVLYRGKYTNQTDSPVSSKAYRDFN